MTGDARPGLGGEAPREAPHEAPREAPREAPPEAPREAPPEAPREAPRDVARAAARTPREQRARREVSAGGVVYRVATRDDDAPQALFLLIRDSYRNWGFPKGHLEQGELPDAAALREVHEETGLARVELRGAIETIDWYFRFRGRLIHKVCHFYLMESAGSETEPQRAEGITACRWAPYEEALHLVSYANAREVLRRARGMLVTDARATRS